MIRSIFSSRKLTLLLVPEDGGGRTFEFKIPHIILAFSVLLVGLATVMLWVGVFSFFEVRFLSEQIDRIEREKQHLVTAVTQIRQLEVTLRQLQTQSDQLLRILGCKVDYTIPKEDVVNARQQDRYIPAIFRLLSGQIRTVPTMWPVRCVSVQPFEQELNGVLIIVPSGSLVRATAAGRVIKSGLDEKIGRFVRVDHGNGLLTLYGYTRSVIAKVGDYVYRGQPIALSGISDDDQPVLFYGVSENGQFCDPHRFKLWL